MPARGPAHDDLCAVTDDMGRVRREFTADALNELWLADVAERWTREGKLYAPGSSTSTQTGSWAT